ncbi:MAG: phosphoribosyltransferase [Acidimicrobiales bacterium]
MPTEFRDRADAGRQLARALSTYAGRRDVRVLGLPRGGVAVAFEVASALAAPLDVFLVRKLGVPVQPELAMGAIAPGGVQVIDHELVRHLRVSQQEMDETIAAESEELRRREEAYRGDRPPLELGGMTVILVDDGIATGSTMRAAVESTRLLGPAAVVAAVPVAPATALRDLGAVADEVVCLATPRPFRAIGLWYRDFTQMTDDQVRHLLASTPAQAPD